MDVKVTTNPTPTPTTSVQGDPSGGPATLTHVKIDPDPIQPGTDEDIILHFQFADPTGKKFTDFRWTHSYTETGVTTDAKYLGIWFQALDSNRKGRWKTDDLFSVITDGTTMEVKDKNPAPHRYSYLYVVEWTENGSRYVCDPKIMNQSGGILDQPPNNKPGLK